MNKVTIKGIYCQGCARQLEGIFNSIYGVKNVVVSQEDCSVVFEGYVSKRIIEQALRGTDYKMIDFVSN